MEFLIIYGKNNKCYPRGTELSQVVYCEAFIINLRRNWDVEDVIKIIEVRGKYSNRKFILLFVFVQSKAIMVLSLKQRIIF